ncbi:PIG-L family deacetylase [Synoicihabitans lomoniglobus]|uniref:PIG-L family deacetylase n=1 Tax=Synoicihabitans lomoniglobus TaxID=2909285 RepID=A0AAE9ZWQ7_9BACT|nr:PIG-L family deacetylase [Opitutaceae bacterium LMO-M01]WED64599.1 PIG-L family deacetylase [Opitutaceae bacterium LMO-M01]
MFTPLAVLGTMTQAQTAPPSAGVILEDLERLRETARVLYVAAHPDDENTRLIAYLANGRHYQTAYLSLTRGDGGQNLIGPELRDALGVIRTQELLAARRIDGGRQFFSRANDFGYSKSADEALSVWDRQEVLADTVRVIREFRPDVIVTRFSPTRGGTHGHHTGSAVMAVEAFALAGDPQAFADELGHLEPWQPQRVVWNAWSWGGAVHEGALTMEVGGYDAVRGESFGEIAARSRSQHRSQGFGSVGSRGNAAEQFVHLVGDEATTDLMDGVTDTWTRYPGGDAIAMALDAILHGFDPRHPGQSVSALLAVKKALTALPPNDVFVAEKHAQLDQVLAACLGLYAEATVENARVAPGEPLKLTHAVVWRQATPVAVTWQSVRYLADDETVPVGRVLQLNENETLEVTRNLPVDTALTHPYWLELPSTAGMAQVANASLIGTPENEPAYAMVYTFEVGGETLAVPVAPVQVTRDRVRGELRDTLQVIAPVAVSFTQHLEHFKPGETRTITVQATSARAHVEGVLSLDLPTGWTATPLRQEFALSAVGDRTEAAFAVTAPEGTTSVKLGVHAIVGGRRFDRDPQVVAYDHIPVQMLQPTATLTAMSFDLKIRGDRVGFLPGAGDTTAEALTLMGYDVTVLTEADLTADGLAGWDAVVLGIRAFNTRAELADHRAALWDYVKAGGNVIVQYNTNGGLPDGSLGPYPLSISRDRVTDETAAVTLLDPAHPAMTGPNRITAADFDGWVQERGLYFPNEWDAAYTPLLSMADPDEAATQGSLLVAKHGDGYFVYTGLSFFRELPAGVPGAYRLLANLVSLE